MRDRKRRTKGTGFLYQRAGSPFWWVGFTATNGRAVRESSRSARKADAEKLLRTRLAAVDKGEHVGPEADRLTFADLAEGLRRYYRLSENRSTPRMERALGHLARFFGGMKAKAITTDKAREYEDTRSTEGAAKATRHYELAMLKKAVALTVEDGRLPHRLYYKLGAVQNARCGFFERVEFDALRAELPAALRPVVTFAFLTGWRVPSEVLTLEWSRVDFAAGLLRLDAGTTKNGEGRVFPFDDAIPELADVLRGQREATDEVQRRTGSVVRQVFHRDGKPIADFRAAWVGACRRAGLIGRVPHDFRRTAVRNLVRAGVPELTAMRLTGHKTRSIFDRYDIQNEADLRAGVAKLAALHAGQPEPRTVLPFRRAASVR